MGTTCHERLAQLCSGSNEHGCCFKHFNYLKWRSPRSPTIPPARHKALTFWTAATMIMEAKLTLVTKFVSCHVSRSPAGGGGGAGSIKVMALRRTGSLYHMPAVTRFETTEGVPSKLSEFQRFFMIKTPYSKLSWRRDKGLFFNLHRSATSFPLISPRKEIKLQRWFMLPFTLPL